MDEVFKGELKPKGSQTSSFEVPFDVIELPSKGKLYKGTTLEGKTSLEIQYLTAAQEDILTSPNLLQSGKVLDVLLRSVIRDKRINTKELLLGDRNAIVVWLRSTGYGELYPVELACKSCSFSFTNEFDLSKLETKELTEEPDEDGLFSLNLPTRKNVIKYSLLTAGDEEKIMRMIEDRRKKTNSQVMNAATIRMKYMIKSIDGNSDLIKISNYVDSMPVKDSRYFRNIVNEIEPGIIMGQEVSCPSCGNVNKEDIPIRENFFWPDI